VQPLPGDVTVGAAAAAAAEADETNDGSSSEEAWTDEDDAFYDWVQEGDTGVLTRKEKEKGASSSTPAPRGTPGETSGEPASDVGAHPSHTP
jgi:hypothetical protein